MSRGYKKIDRVRKLLRRLPDEITAEVKKVISNSIQEIHYHQLQDVPKRTGQLARAIKYRIEKDGLKASSGLSNQQGFKREWRMAGWRGHFVEFGTIKQAAQPFIFNGLRKQIPVIKKEIKEAVKKALRSA
jgi:HK97 gp10 family phage protein